MKKRTSIIACLLVLLCSVVEAGNIHVIVFAHDADPSVGKGSAANITRLKETFSQLVPANMFRFRVYHSDFNVKGDDVWRWKSADDVRKAIRKMEVNADDTLFVFIHCHGGHKDGNHFLEMPDLKTTLFSQHLRKVVNQKPCKLKVILSDSCNVPEDFARAAPKIGLDWDVKDGIAPVMQELFLNHAGLLHMNGSRQGEFGYTDTDGSWLCKEFTNFLRMYPKSTPDWLYMDRYLHQEMGKRFQDELNGSFTDRGYTAKSLGVVYWSMARRAETRWAAIALNENSGKYHYVKNYKELEAAEQTAKRNVGNGSKIILSTNKSYIAMASGLVGGWGTGHGDTPEEASEEALKYAKQNDLAASIKFCVFNGQE